MWRWPKLLQITFCSIGGNFFGFLFGQIFIRFAQSREDYMYQKMVFKFFSHSVSGFPVSGRPLKNGSRIFFPTGVRFSGLPKTPKFPISDFRHSLDWRKTKRAGCIYIYIYINIYIHTSKTPGMFQVLGGGSCSDADEIIFSHWTVNHDNAPPKQ